MIRSEKRGEKLNRKICTSVGSDKGDLNEEKTYSIKGKVRKVPKQTWVYSVSSRRQEGIMMKKMVANISKCD